MKAFAYEQTYVIEYLNKRYAVKWKWKQEPRKRQHKNKIYPIIYEPILLYHFQNIQKTEWNQCSMRMREQVATIKTEATINIQWCIINKLRSLEKRETKTFHQHGNGAAFSHSKWNISQSESQDRRQKVWEKVSHLKRKPQEWNEIRLWKRNSVLISQWKY